MKTFSAKTSDIQRKWFVVDAENQVLGRLASRVACILRGKHKAVYTPHVDTGDHVVVINAEKVRVTGSKETTKVYRRHSGWVGGQKEMNVKTVRARRPEFLIEHAVRGMVPHTRLGRAMLRKLKVYKGVGHPHAAQNPEPLKKI